jgi:hypothetical protein
MNTFDETHGLFVIDDDVIDYKDDFSGIREGRPVKIMPALSASAGCRSTSMTTSTTRLSAFVTSMVIVYFSPM